MCVALFLKQPNEYTKMYRPFVKIIKKRFGGAIEEWHRQKRIHRRKCLSEHDGEGKKIRKDGTIRNLDRVRFTLHERSKKKELVLGYHHQAFFSQCWFLNFLEKVS